MRDRRCGARIPARSRSRQEAVSFLSILGKWFRFMPRATTCCSRESRVHISSRSRFWTWLASSEHMALFASIDRAAGWHICFDVLDHLLSGTPIGRIVGPEAMKFGGWQRLHAEYAKQFGVETPNWPPQAAQNS